MTPLERRLSETPLRAIPPQLRTRILAASRPRPALPALALALAARIFSHPHPLAWGALAAGWLAIAALNLSGPRGSELYAVTPREYRDRLPSAQEYLVQFELRGRLLARLATDAPEEQPTFHLRREKL